MNGLEVSERVSRNRVAAKTVLSIRGGQLGQWSGVWTIRALAHAAATQHGAVTSHTTRVGYKYYNNRGSSIISPTNHKESTVRYLSARRTDAGVSAPYSKLWAHIDKNKRSRTLYVYLRTRVPRRHLSMPYSSCYFYRQPLIYSTNICEKFIVN